MDAKGKDGSKNRRREETLARRVGEALDQMNPSGAPECPDAEILAAYADQRLALDETAQWEDHFATCARCRNVLRVLAASSDTPLAETEVARLGELVAAARAPSIPASKPSHIVRSWAWDWRVRWLAPALGVAAVFAVWLAMRPPWRTTDQGGSPALVAQAPKEMSPPIPQPTVQLSTGVPLEDKQALKSRSGPPNMEGPVLDSRSKVTAGSPAAARDELRSTTGNHSGAESALQKKAEVNQPTNEREVRPEAGSTSPPLPPAPQAQAVAGGLAAPQSETKSSSELIPQKTLSSENVQSEATNSLSPPAALAKRQQAAGGLAQPEVSSHPSVSAPSRQAFGALKAKEPTPPVLAKSPTSDAILWRAGRGGTVEHSSDSGRSWTPQASPSQEDWLSGAAVSDTVCWLAGRNGAIARTVDGEHWDRISAPAQAAGSDGVLPAWTSIVARDAQFATVTAGDGRRFVTANGGKTWQPQQ